MSEPAIPIGVPQRTNPVSVLAQGASAVRNALFPMIAIFFGSGSRGYSVMLALGIGVLVIAVGTLRSYIRWRRLTYTVGQEDIRVESGVLSRAARSVPYDRIQDVSLEQALIPRLFGLVEVRFETGAGGKDELKLAFLRESEGEALRELVRAQKDGAGIAVPEASGAGEASGDGVATLEAASEVLFAMPPKRLVTFGLFEFSLAVFAVLAGLAQYADTFAGIELWDPDLWMEWLAGPGDWIAHLGPMAQVISAIAGLVTLFVVGSVTGLVRTVLRDWGFVLERTAKGFRRRRGLLTRTDVVMPAHRVQALEIGTRMIRRRFGWHGLKFVSLAQDAGGASHDVAPFAKLGELAPIVTAAGFAMPPDDLDWQRSSKSYRNAGMWIDAIIPSLLGLVLLGIALLTDSDTLGGRWWVALIPFAIGMFLALRQFFLWRYARNAIDDRQLYRRSGWLAPSTAIANRVKLQSVEIAQGPLARLRGYATLHLGLAGGSFVIAGLPLDRAQQLRAAILDSISATDFSELT